MLIPKPRVTTTTPGSRRWLIYQLYLTVYFYVSFCILETARAGGPAPMLILTRRTYEQSIVAVAPTKCLSVYFYVRFCVVMVTQHCVPRESGSSHAHSDWPGVVLVALRLYWRPNTVLAERRSSPLHIIVVLQCSQCTQYDVF